MSDMNESGNDRGKKQFYTLNLTSERIFIIFVLFVILIAVVIIVAALTFNRGSSNKDVSDKEYEFLNEITGSEYEYHDLLSGENEENIVDVLPEETTQQSTVVEDVKTVQEVDEKASANQPVIKTDSDKVIYSSSLSEEKSEPKKIEKASVEIKQTKPIKEPSTQVTKPVEKKIVKTESKQTTKIVQVEKYVIQIGSYSTQKSAEDVSNYYKKEGYPVYTKSFAKDGKTYYRLRIGPYDEKKKAEGVLGKVKVSKYGKDSFISVGYF